MMGWNLRIGRFFGIDVFVHATFSLLLLWVVFQTYRSTGDWMEVLDQLLFVILLFTIVVLHEYGHALTARLFGIKTRDIILLPIGGVARLESIPQKPWQELLIAVAGPAVNVVLAMICGAWVFVEVVLTAIQPEVKPQGDVVQSVMDLPLSARLLIVNITIVVFNMIPAFPMDGGRVLRSILAMFLDYVRATQIAAYIGQGFALLLALWAFYPAGNVDIFRLLIALFVWTGARQEALMVRQRAVLSGSTVGRAMSTSFVAINPFDTLEQVARLGHRSTPGFPVLHGDELVGLLTPRDLSAAIAKLGGQRHVSEVMRREPLVARPDETLMDVLPRLQQQGALLVVDGGRLVGLLGIQEVGQVLSGKG